MNEIKVIKQRIKLPIKNVEIKTADENKKSYSKHGALLPNSVRSLIVGASNCGKTNVMISLLENPTQPAL